MMLMLRARSLLAELRSRTRAITCGAVFTANQPILVLHSASRDVARVVSDVSVLCPPRGVYLGNKPTATRRNGTRVATDDLATINFVLTIEAPKVSAARHASHGAADARASGG